MKDLFRSRPIRVLHHFDRSFCYTLCRYRTIRNAALMSIGVTAVLLAGCSAAPQGGQAVSAASRTASVPSEAGAGAQVEGQAALAQSGSSYRQPLTGLPAQNADNRRPIMVMINNHSAARPQSGLSEADILIECLAEGEITRFAAFFQGHSFTGKIGPVRSIRPYYIDLGRMYDAVEIHAGGSPDAYAWLDEQHIDHLDEITNAGRYFWRESFRKQPHNLYTDLAHIRAGEAKLGLRADMNRAPAIAFAPAVPKLKGSPASHLDVTFLLKNYVVSYQYNELKGVYSRSINGKPHIDLNNGHALTAANVLILGADHKVLDAEGRREVKLIGSGKAVLLQNGKAFKGAWLRKSSRDGFRFLSDDGNAAPLLRGQTHYLIVPNAPAFEDHFKYY